MEQKSKRTAAAAIAAILLFYGAAQMLGITVCRGNSDVETCRAHFTIIPCSGFQFRHFSCLCSVTGFRTAYSGAFFS